MKTTIATAVALACVSTQVFASKIKEDTITFSLTAQGQTSVSTTTGQNVGLFSSGPSHYKTGKSQLTQVNILRSIGLVMHNNAGYYTSQAKLVLSQGELSGFFNITPDLAGSIANTNFILAGPFLPFYWGLDGTQSTFDFDGSTALANSFDSTYARLDTGRHFEPVPPGYNTSGEWPPGHMQPWGQIFVKDLGHKDSSGNPLCENVTFFFGLTVQECYDCFYLNSFISDSTFTFKAGTQSGPPCCSVASSMLGVGIDKYYLTLNFDNTINNPYLDYLNVKYTGWDGLNIDTNFFTEGGGVDGIFPDGLPYDDIIHSGDLGRPSPFEMRFTLDGIVTYNWKLQFVDPNDASPDFVGTASYSATGFGFIGLVCQLLTGSATFSEKIVNDTLCCDDLPWYDDWYGVGEYNPLDLNSAGQGNPASNLNLYFDYYSNAQPTPLNVAPSLTYHASYYETYEPWTTQTTW